MLRSIRQRRNNRGRVAHNSAREKRQIKALIRANPEDISLVPNRNQYSLCRVVKVYDGDTFTILTLLNGDPRSYFKTKVRLMGIDTPEIKSKAEDIELHHLEERAARIVRDYVIELILEKIVQVKIVKFDKWGGRVNGYLRFDTLPDLSEHLIEKGYAQAYSGKGKKRPFERAFLEKIVNNYHANEPSEKEV